MKKKTKLYTILTILLVVISSLMISFFYKGNFTFAQESDMVKKTISVNNEDRVFFIYLPSKYKNETKKLPVVILLHGTVATADKIKNYTKFNSFADKNDIIVVYPENTGTWDWDLKPAEKSKDIEFIRQMISTMETQYNVDNKRVYVTGYSSGAEMTYLLACTLSDKIAAFAPVCGNMREEYMQGCHNCKPVPMLLVHGTEDPYEKWNGDPNKKMLSVDDVLKYWKSKNKNEPSETKEFIYPHKDPNITATTAKLEITDYPKDKTEVSILKIEGGGHTWPDSPTSVRIETFLGKTNYDVSANEIIWDFFKRHKLN